MKTVKIRGVEYVITGIGPANTDGRFFGSRRVNLRDPDGGYWYLYTRSPAARINGNARLIWEGP